MNSNKKSIACLLMLLLCLVSRAQSSSLISGKVLSSEKEIIDYAHLHLKGTTYGCILDEQGIYHLKAPAGTYTLVVSAIGYETVEKQVVLKPNQRIKLNLTLRQQAMELDEVVVLSGGVSSVKRSAYNAVAVDTRELQNSTKTLGDALAKLPGMKLRESGGVGSDMQLTLDGFSGKHVKVFIDSVPQEGVGSSFGLNNIPVHFAERIEVYKGVVPIEFGTDALGGVVNIVTRKQLQRWFLDASYSYGLFHTQVVGGFRPYLEKRTDVRDQRFPELFNPALPDYPDHARYLHYFPKGGRSIFTLDLRGGITEAQRFIDSLKIFSLLANVADLKLLVIHPATTTHSQLNERELEEQQIKPGTVRLSIGTEHVDDLIADLEQALAQI